MKRPLARTVRYLVFVRHQPTWLCSVVAMVCLASPYVSANEPLCVVSSTGDRRLDTYVVRDSGTLSLQSRTEIDSRPGASAFDASGRLLFVAGSAPDTISVFQVGQAGLTHLQTVEVPGKPSFLQMTPSGRYLLASYFKTGQVTVHRCVGRGRISDEPIQVLKTDPHAHCVAVDRSGRFVFVPHTSVSRISQFRLDAENGQLWPSSPAYLHRDHEVAPRHLWFHPSNHLVVGSNERGQSISTYRLNQETGLLSELDTASSMPQNTEGKATTSHVEFHPSGRFAYIANRGHGTIAVFTVDHKTGKLALLERAETESLVRSFSLSPDGRCLVAAGQKSNRLLCYRIADNGTLAKMHTIDSGKTPWWVSFSPTAGMPETSKRR